MALIEYAELRMGDKRDNALAQAKAILLAATGLLSLPLSSCPLSLPLSHYRLMNINSERKGNRVGVFLSGASMQCDAAT